MGSKKMKKQIVMEDEKFQEEFMTIFSLGLVECLEKNLIDSKRAEQWLFSPVIAYSLKTKKFSKKFIEAMKNASEIDAMVNADYYLKNLQEIKKIFIDSLQDLNKFPMDSSESFLKGLI